MDTITMWADLSSRVSDARSEKRPLSSTSEPVNNDLETNSKQSNTITVITSFDAAKIRKDAETAIEKDNKISMQKSETSVFYSNAERAVDVTPEMKQSVMEGQPMFFRTEEGEVYGFTMDGKIYIDPKVATSETPIHEYSHLWAQALRKANPQAWEQLKSEMMKDQELDEYRELAKLMSGRGKKKTTSDTRKLNSPEGEKAYVTVISDAESGAKIQKILTRW